MTNQPTRSRLGAHSVFVGDDAHITTSNDPRSPFSTDIYIRDADLDPLVSLHLTLLALRRLQGTCDRAIKSIEVEDAKRADEPMPYAVSA